MSMNRQLSAALILLAGLIAAPTSARAETFNTCAGFIDTLPATIATQGVWCMRHDVTTAITSGNAITINTNNVTIDCNDFKLGGLQAGAGTTATGIYALDRLNASVRHCNIRGFRYGVNLDGSGAGSGGHLVEDSRFDGNTYIGIHVYGDGSLIQRNRVNTTGGSTFNPGLGYGISTVYGVDLLDNSVDGVAPAANPTPSANSAFGIYTFNNTNGSLIGNRVRGVASLYVYGIFNTNSGRISLRRNDVVGPGTYGMYCSSTAGSAKDNIMNGFTSGLTGCTNDGGNAIK